MGKVAKLLRQHTRYVFRYIKAVSTDRPQLQQKAVEALDRNVAEWPIMTRHSQLLREYVDIKLAKGDITDVKKQLQKDLHRVTAALVTILPRQPSRFAQRTAIEALQKTMQQYLLAMIRCVNHAVKAWDSSVYQAATDAALRQVQLVGDILEGNVELV